MVCCLYKVGFLCKSVHYFVCSHAHLNKTKSYPREKSKLISNCEALQMHTLLRETYIYIYIYLQHSIIVSFNNVPSRLIHLVANCHELIELNNHTRMILNKTFYHTQVAQDCFIHMAKFLSINSAFDSRARRNNTG
jgi:hypothetical protein